MMNATKRLIGSLEHNLLTRYISKFHCVCRRSNVTTTTNTNTNTNANTETTTHTDTYTREHDDTTKYIKRKVKFDYDTYAGPSTNYDLAPLLVSHGLFSNKKEWVKPCRELNALTGRKVICYDSVNHGSSSHHASMTYHALAHDMINFLELIDIDKSVVSLGHRMGSKAAMTLALVKPEKISQILVLDGAPCTRNESLLGDTTLALKAVSSVDLSTLEDLDAVRKKLESIPLVPLLLTLVMDNVVPKQGGGFRLLCNVTNIMENYKALIDFPQFLDEVVYEGPALFVGDCERGNDEESIQERFTNAHFHHIPGMPFDVHKDMPEHIITTIADFINTQTTK